VCIELESQAVSNHFKMAMMQLRVKHKGGQCVLTSLKKEDKVDDLLKQLFMSTNIPVERIKLLKGFPPRPIDISDTNILLCHSSIQDRDTLLVEELPASQSVVANTDTSKASTKAEKSPPPQQPTGIPDRTGILLRKVVPSDNSCLFTSIRFCLSGKLDSQSSIFMRELVASAVKNQPEQYSEALLGKSNKEYQKWILREDSWGGAIELAILSSYYGLEIDVVNTQHSVINKFGEDQDYGQRILLIYDGIHYDPLYLEPFSVSTTPTTENPEKNKLLMLTESEKANSFKIISKLKWTSVF